MQNVLFGIAVVIRIDRTFIGICRVVAVSEYAVACSIGQTVQVGMLAIHVAVFNQPFVTAVAELSSRSVEAVSGAGYIAVLYVSLLIVVDKSGEAVCFRFHCIAFHTAVSYDSGVAAHQSGRFTVCLDQCNDSVSYVAVVDSPFIDGIQQSVLEALVGDEAGDVFQNKVFGDKYRFLFQ